MSSYTERKKVDEHFLLYYSYKSSRQTLNIGTNWKKHLIKFQAAFQGLHLQQWDPDFVCMVGYLR